MAKYQKYNSRRVRRFLKTAFPTTEDLIEFCQDYYHEVLSSFGSSMSLKGMITALFDRCHDDQALEVLLECCRECVIEDNKEDVWERFVPFERPGYVPATPTGANWYENEEQRFFEALLQFNYGQQVETFRQFLATQRPISFLIRGPNGHGQRLLLHQLFRCVPNRENSKWIKRSLDRYGRSYETKFLWYELGKEVNIPREKAGAPEAIAHRIHNYLQSQHVIFIFNNAGLTDKGYLSRLMREFWHPLLDELAHIGPLERRPHQLIMFIIDYRGQADLQGVDWIEKFHADSTSHAKRPVKLELSAFSEKEVRGWFDSHAYRVLPTRLISQVDRIMHDLLKIKVTENVFVPERTLEKICHCCGYDWIEGEYKWFKL